VSLAGAIFVVVAFSVIGHYLQLVHRTQDVVHHTQHAIAVLQDSSRDDRNKEQALQRSALKLFALLGQLLLGIATALLLPLAILWSVDIAGISVFHETLVMLQRWEFLIGASFIGGAVYVALRRIVQ